MTNTDILLEDLEDVLDDATSIPLSKKYAVDVDKIKTIIEDIRLKLLLTQEIQFLMRLTSRLPTLLQRRRRKQESS